MAQKSLAERNAALCATPNYPVSGGSEMLAVSSGDLVSPERTTNPSPSGIEQYMIIRVFGSIKNSHASVAAVRTKFGASNVIKSLQYNDTTGYSRHTNVSGRALELISYARQYDVVGGSMDVNPTYGVEFQNGTSDVCPASIAAGATVDFSHTFYLPFAYSSLDQRGAVPAALAMGQQTLKLLFPTKAEAFVATGANPFKALFIGGTCEWVTLGYEVVTMTKNRNLPQELPIELFGTTYQITETARSNLTAGTDNKFGLEPSRQHFNIFQVYDNGGVLNVETDVNSLSMLFGGSHDARRLSPQIHNAIARNTLKGGIPAGVYYANMRDDPLDVMTKGGSIDLVFNPKTVATGAVIYTVLDYLQAGTTVSM